jgi:hypothetical protein
MYTPGPYASWEALLWKLVEQLRTPCASVAGNLVCRSNSSAETCDGESDKVNKMVDRSVGRETKWKSRRSELCLTKTGSYHRLKRVYSAAEKLRAPRMNTLFSRFRNFPSSCLFLSFHRGLGSSEPRQPGCVVVTLYRVYPHLLPPPT